MNHAIKPAQDSTTALPSRSEELRPLTRDILEEQTREVARLALHHCTFDETVRLQIGGRELELRPLDTRRFVLHMSRFISMN